MAKELKILVACGSGVATSTVAQEAVKKICRDAGIPAKIIKSTMTEIPAKQADVDIVMVTTNYRQKLDKPLIKVFGINEDKIRDEIIDTCHRLQNEN